MDFQSAIIIPCYNERERFPRFWNALKASNPGSLLVPVDDGSEFPLEIADEGQTQALAYPENRGKGHAVRYGWDWVRRHHPGIQTLAFCDADGAVSALEVARLLELARTLRVDALLASRVCLLGRDVRRYPLRHYMGRCFATYLSVLLDLPAYDTQCGCKVVRAEAYGAVAEEMKIDGFSFDVELILRLRRRGYCVREEPVDWSEQEGSKVRVLRDSWKMIAEVNRIRRALDGS